MFINVCILSGLVKWPALRYDATGKPEFRFAVAQTYGLPNGQQGEKSYPCYAVGAQAERLAEQLEAGMDILVHGSIQYRKRETKAGEVSRQETYVKWVEVGDRLSESPQVARSPLGEEGARHHETPQAERKVRRPRYPQQRYTGTITGSVN